MNKINCQDEYVTIPFKIVTFCKTDNGFEENGFDQYKINFLVTGNPYKLKIVVNNKLTRFKVNIETVGCGFKNAYLLGIKEYLENDLTEIVDYDRILKTEAANNIYPEHVINCLNNHVLPANKLEKRDTITKMGFIK